LPIVTLYVSENTLQELAILEAAKAIESKSKVFKDAIDKLAEIQDLAELLDILIDQKEKELVYLKQRRKQAGAQIGLKHALTEKMISVYDKRYTGFFKNKIGRDAPLAVDEFRGQEEYYWQLTWKKELKLLWPRKTPKEVVEILEAERVKRLVKVR